MDSYRTNSVKRLFLIGALSFLTIVITAQELPKPTVICGTASGIIKVDGKMDEPFWMETDSIINFQMVEPQEGGVPSYRTVAKIAASDKHLIIGIICYDPDPLRLVSFSKSRDSQLENEDNIKIILDTYRDGRNGFIFSINPNGARYDALVANSGEGENPNWDGIWEAETFTGEDYWSAEISIPVSSLTFRKGLTSWGLNLERRIQRKLEVVRWSAISRNFKMGQTNQAGILANIPGFSMGTGLTPRVSTLVKAQRSATTDASFTWSNSLDLTQKITPDITAQLTVNTDFAETEVDSRKTNLTRFPLLYPEKRQFFLEGSDIYDFGLGLGRESMPFFSRRIGLLEGQEVPVRWGLKVNGKLEDTNFGMLVNETGEVDSLGRSTMGVLRIKQNIFKESHFGIISTFGDPYSIDNSWMTGFDFTYRTSEFLNDKNFLAGFWGLFNNKAGVTGETSSYGFKIDYPNDLLDLAFTFTHIGDGFDPSLGFFPRKAINSYVVGANYSPRPQLAGVRQFFFESRTFLYTNLENRWESYRVFTAPLHFLLESGDRFEFNIQPTGEALDEPFEIADGVEIPAGQYNWTRYRMELETASKRKIGGQVTWWFGGFYGGRLNQYTLEMKIRPLPQLILELNYEKNIGDLPFGSFSQELYATRVQLNFTSNLNLSSYIQYDNESRNAGSYTRLRWTFTPRGDLFVVYKHNMVNSVTERWEYSSNQLIVKLSYGLAL